MYNIFVPGGKGRNKDRPTCCRRRGGLKGGEPLEDGYTDFGYMLNGIEYATVEEALEANQQ